MAMGLSPILGPISREKSHTLSEEVKEKQNALCARRAAEKPLWIILYFQYYGSMTSVHPAKVLRFADMFSAMGTEPRLRIMQLLMTAEPEGLVVGDIQSELEIPNSTLSHHLDKLKNEGLVIVRREGTYLWYRANIEALKELLGFLYAECCTRNRVVKPEEFVAICK
jgi:ArsR family transcriptional regulator